jgi:hypothetical protein
MNDFQLEETGDLPVFDVDEMESTREWFERKGNKVFGTFAGFQWFMRLNRDELMQSGIYFPGRGSAPTRVGPGFGKLVISIMQRSVVEEGSAEHAGATVSISQTEQNTNPQ